MPAQWSLTALALQVIGCLKGVLATTLSVLIFGNSVSAIGVLGYAITVTGVLAYGWSKVKSSRCEQI